MDAERDPRPPDEDDPERARRLQRLSRYVQAGGVVFLAVVSLGLLPTILAASSPALGERAAMAVWLVAPAIPVGLLVVAALRLPR
jgi:hypothetical protein